MWPGSGGPGPLSAHRQRDPVLESHGTVETTISTHNPANPEGRFEGWDGEARSVGIHSKPWT